MDTVAPTDPCFPLATEAPYLFGWEAADSICTAVLRLPGGSPPLRDLVAYTDARVPVPPWWPLKDRIRQRVLARVRARTCHLLPLAAHLRRLYMAAMKSSPSSGRMRRATRWS